MRFILQALEYNVEDYYSLLQLYTQLYVKTTVYTAVYLPQLYIRAVIYIWVYLCI